MSDAISPPPARAALRGRTAIVVIHGIGQQSPFETLDDYARTLADELRQSTEVEYRMEHRLVRRVDATGTPWIESFVRISPKASPGNAYIDVHEYYWAYLFQRSVTRSEVWKWIEEVWNRIADQYAQQREIAERFDYDGGAAEKRILRLVKSARFSFWRRLYQALEIAASWVSWLRPVQAALEKVAGAVERKVDPVLIGYVGDVAIYTTTNPLAAQYATRQKALAGAVAFTSAVLDEDDVDRVILAGHSLGSVIAYDTVNRLVSHNHVNESPKNLAKLAGLVTFGSPLDRILLYFLPNKDEDRPLRLRILEQIHAFRTQDFYGFHHEGLQPLDAAWTPPLQQMKWLNFWIRTDPISGPLRFYAPVTNVELAPVDDEKMGAAHGRYWGCREMFAQSLEQLEILGPPGGVAMPSAGGRRATDGPQRVVADELPSQGPLRVEKTAEA